MNATQREILTFVKENDVKFIKLAFCDLYGKQKNISMLAGELERAFEEGVSFDASAIDGFTDVTHSDLFLFPDPGTLSVLPWRPQQGRVIRFFCDIRYPDGTPYEKDFRYHLKHVVDEISSAGYAVKIGSECEFYLFKTDEEGEPTLLPFDHAGYLDVAPDDRGENVRREICLTLEEMGIQPESSHHEQGPGQNEVDFHFSDPLTAADHLITFQSVVKTVAVRNGLVASFDPKPLPEEAGNGFHINISLFKGGNNLFDAGEKDVMTPEAASFMAGVMNRIKEITAFLNPSYSSYERFGSFQAPAFISWSKGNRSQLIRLPKSTGLSKRMELRSPDPSANPYMAFYLLLSAGLEGLRTNANLPQEVPMNMYKLEDKPEEIDTLPVSLKEAIQISKRSRFAKSVLGKDAVTDFLKGIQ